MFADVAVPVYVRQTFTYRVPPHLEALARVGCRATVALRKKTLTGFIVALSHEVDPGEAGSEIRDLEAILDDEPVIAPDILELTRWMSDYYYAPWGECLRASLPAGATTISERQIAITQAGREELADQTSRSPDAKRAALRLLADVE